MVTVDTINCKPDSHQLNSIQWTRLNPACIDYFLFITIEPIKLITTKLITIKFVTIKLVTIKLITVKLSTIRGLVVMSRETINNRLRLMVIATVVLVRWLNYQ